MRYIMAMLKMQDNCDSDQKLSWSLLGNSLTVLDKHINLLVDGMHYVRNHKAFGKFLVVSFGSKKEGTRNLKLQLKRGGRKTVS